MIKIFIPGAPIAQGRPRFAHGHAYDPPKSSSYKEQIRLFVKAAMQGKEPLSGALWLSVQVYILPPKSWPRKRQQAAAEGVIRPVSRPDLSNYLKGVEDALNGVLWVDDSAIVEYRQPMGKYYSLSPGLVICCGEVE